MEHTYLGTFLKSLRFRYKRLGMKKKSLVYSVVGNRDPNRKTGIICALRCYTGRFATTIFSLTLGCNIGSML